MTFLVLLCQCQCFPQVNITFWFGIFKMLQFEQKVSLSLFMLQSVTPLTLPVFPGPPVSMTTLLAQWRATLKFT